MIDNGVDLGSIGSANTVALFNSILAQSIFADIIHAQTVKAHNGVFTDITVEGKSTLKGQIDNDAITSFGKSETHTVFNGNTNSIWYRISQDASSGGYGYTTVANMTSLFGSNAISGMYTGSITTNSHTFTADETAPFIVQYEPNKKLNISGGNISITGADWMEPTRVDNYLLLWNNGVGSPEHFIGPKRALYQQPTAPTDGLLVSVNISSVESLGGFYSHDIIPKNKNADKIGSSNLPFKEIHGNKFSGNVNGTDVSDNSSFKVWGAVFN